MPFTFSHPALILPFTALQRRYYSLTGLVVGSIVPDFEYFLRMEKGSPHYSHSLALLFTSLIFNKKNFFKEINTL